MDSETINPVSEDFKEYCKFYNLRETVLELSFYLGCKYSSGKNHQTLIDNRVVHRELSLIEK